MGREILNEYEIGGQTMTLGGQLPEHAPEDDHIDSARSHGQGWILLAEMAQPAEQMGIAAQRGQWEGLRETDLEKGEEVTGCGSIVSAGRVESLNECGEDLSDVIIGGMREQVRSHRVGGKAKRVRFWTARAYSRQTSWGAS